MPRGGARPNTGGARPGAGRKSIKTEREILEQLQKLLPEAFVSIDKEISNPGFRSNGAGWKLLDKFIGDRKVTELTNEGDSTLKIEIVEDIKHLHDE